MMVTFPSPRGTPWRLPHRPWHPDFMFNHPQTPMAGVTLFAFVGDVGAHGGGTLLVAGSHRLVARFVEGLPSGVRSDYRRVRTSFLAHDPWLGELSSPDDATDASDAADRAARFMAADHDITGMPVRVVELTGNAGDVVVTHPWTFHCTAPNTADEPRMMRARTIHARHDVGDA
jgi:ectoine hydroxylase-related dioxygenase (phytanoyl-CoA dioxygenase family)